ncbi:MAG: hypothetical protein OEV64_01325 [Desulfobulbaceae bacterium]|nr:hypothetical protein [Desulfobulbaceae bacterium]
MVRINSFKNQFTLKYVIVILLLSLLFSTILVYHRFKVVSSSFIDITMSSQTTSNLTITQLFIDTGRGFNEKESIVLPVESNQKFKTLRFVLPDTDIFAVRFDPISIPGTITIQKIELIDFLGDSHELISFDKITPLKDIESIVQEQDRLIIKTKNIEPVDASFLLDITESLDKMISRINFDQLLVFFLLLVTILSTTGITLYYIVFKVKNSDLFQE